MRPILLSVFIVILLSSFASAEIIIEQQPEDIYNLGDVIPIPVIIKASKDISGSFYMDLLCNGLETTFFLKDVDLAVGEEESLNPILILNKERLGNTIGPCKIKAILKDENISTNEFKISDIITIEIEDTTTVFNPGENILIEGEAIKENGDNAEGFIELEINNYNQIENINQLETINDGFFSVNTFLPEDMEAGNYLLKLTAYEKDQDGRRTNEGSLEYNIYIRQVPTNLEIFFENPEIEPGTNLLIKAILRDQTGEKIEATAIITIKNEKDKILEQTEKPTDEFLEYHILYNEPPTEWSVVAASYELASEVNFKIKEKKDIKIELINKTLILTNIGNVGYCDEIIFVKIGDQPLDIDVCLDVDEIQRYILKAPDGEYQIEIISDGKNITTENIVLTGKTVEIKKASEGIVSLVKYPVVWIFIIVILGFVAFMIFKKGYKKSFFGHMPSFKKKKGKEDKKKKKLEKHRSRWDRIKIASLGKRQLISSTNKAQLSLSLKGDKQNASVVCLKIKNLKELQSERAGSEKALQKIIHVVERDKAFVYENHDNIFFILAPTITKTFKNEKPAIKLAQKIEKILREHNKLFKQKINYGISLNHGEIVAKLEDNILKFMSMGKLITAAKKVADLSEGEILLTHEMNERFGSDLKTQKHTRDKVPVYTVKEMIDRGEHREFISSFLKRMDGEKKKK